MEFRLYDPERDNPAIYRIYREVGWLEEGKEQEAAVDVVLQAGRAHVAEIRGEAECLVLTVPGDIRYLDEYLPFASVGSVTTSRLARRQGIAGRLTARAIAGDAANGALVSGLGMFEQGFYDRLGFGTGGYEHIVAFDPAQLIVDVKPRAPRRITPDNWEKVHASRLARSRRHGSVSFDSPAISQAEMKWSKKSFGLGYYDGPDGELTHHLWIFEEGSHGPYRVDWLAYQTFTQFMELMGVLHSLGDQVHQVRMFEPAGIQLQDLLAQPFRWLHLTEKSKYETSISARALWQMRINDLPACLDRTHLRGDVVCFNLKLTDPIESYLDDEASWRGVAGDYVVTLGPSSGAEAGRDTSLPTLEASVGAFTRMWLGALPATGLAVTDNLAGPEDLLEQLDWLLRLPRPDPDWEI